MTAGLQLTLIVYALGTGTWFAGLAVANRAASPTATAALAVLEVGLVIQAAIDVARILVDHRPAQLGVHLAYLATSLVIVPMSSGGLRLPGRRAVGAAMAACCAILAVVCIRLDQTLVAT